MTSLAISSRLEPARGQLRRTRERLADTRALHGAIGLEFTAWAERNFAAEGMLLDDFPSGWPGLSAATLARRRRGAGARILYRTGRLAHGTVAVPGADGVVVDNPVPYAPVHQIGQGVPRRPVLPGPAQAKRLALPIVEDHVRRALS
jgi:phage gpG-like protein